MEQALFLQRIKSALSRYSTEEEARVLAAPARPKTGYETTMEAKVERFQAEVRELHKVQVIRVRNWDQAREAIGQMLTEREVTSIALAGDYLKPALPFWKKWNVAADFASVEKAEVGVIQADYGLSQTGSVALVASAGKPRTVSLLPPVCFFALSVFDMLESMVSLMEELERRHQKGEMPATVNVVTGPSRTADIELSLTVGVHGPGEVHVVLVG
jgi:L-lactate utilization protein LutC